MTAIPARDAEFHALSFVDVNIRLFWWRDQLYRGIKKQDAEFYRDLVRSALVRDLMKDGLFVKTEVTDLTHPDFALILKHDVFPAVIYPYEWPFAALKSAALLMLELQKRLVKERLCLRDPDHQGVLDDEACAILDGISGGDGLQRRLYPPATERLRSEFVMALALEHHFVFRNMLKFGQIAEALADFSQRWLLVEFVPRGDSVVERYLARYEDPEATWERFFNWYNLENFKAALGTKFSKIAEYPSSPEPRVLLLCEK